MKFKDEANRSLRSARALVLGGVVAIAITILAACLSIWNLHRERIANEEHVTHNLAVVLAEQTARAFQGVDLILQEVQAMVLATGVADADQFRRQMGTFEVHRFLRERLRSLPQANTISLIDHTGKIVSFSRGWPTLSIDVSERDYF